MANNNYLSIISFWLFLLVVYLGIVSDASKETSNILNENRRLPKTKGTIKTIECPEDGVVIDCIDFWQQPAFDDPVTKKLQMMEPTMRNPTEFGMKNESKIARRYHKWNKYGECPKGTIPIRRTQKNNDTMSHRKYPKGGVNAIDGAVHEYVVVHSAHGTYHGASASLNLWKPYVVATEGTEEMSLAQIWVLSHNGEGQTQDTIEAGWQVYPHRYGGLYPRFFVFWSRHNYQYGCYNVQPGCPGFVATRRDISFDCDFDITSEYGGHQVEIEIKIERMANRKWYLYVDGGEIGFWPPNIFTTLADGATSVDWGGEIAYRKAEGDLHTQTAMGSGHFPSEGLQRAAYFQKLKACDNNGWNNADTYNLFLSVTQPNCYNFLMGPPGTESGTFFLYGGPGGPNCDHQ